MAVKLILLAVIVLASFGLGEAVTGAQAEKNELLAQLIRSSHIIRTALVAQGMSLKEALHCAAGCGVGGFFGGCALIIRQQPELEGAAVCRLAAANNKKYQRLCPKSKLLCERLMSALCAAVTTEEIVSACTWFSREAGELLSDAKKEHKRRGAAVKSLCVLGGLILAIILI